MLIDNGERLIDGGSFDIKTVAEHQHRYWALQNLVKGKRVLDAACGIGYGTKILSKTAEEVYGIDISNDAILYAKENYLDENITFDTMSIAKLDFPDKFFDVIISFETIEHVDRETQKLFLKEVKRCLKEAGIFVISTPNDDLYRAMTHGEYYNEFHVAEFTEKSFLQFLKTEFSEIDFYFQNSIDVSCILKRGGSNKIKNGIALDENNLVGRYYLALCSNDAISSKIDNSVLVPKIQSFYNERYLDRLGVLCPDYGCGWDGPAAITSWGKNRGDEEYEICFDVAKLKDKPLCALRFDPCEKPCKMQIISAKNEKSDNLVLEPLTGVRQGEWDIFETPDPIYNIVSRECNELKQITIRYKLFELPLNEVWYKEVALREKKEAEIDNLTVQNGKKAREIDNLTTQNEEKAREINSLTAQNEEKAREIDNLTTQNEEKAREINSLTAQNEEKAEKIETLNNAQMAQNAEIIRLNNEILMIKSSKSWKITAPLRALKKVFTDN